MYVCMDGHVPYTYMHLGWDILDAGTDEFACFQLSQALISLSQLFFSGHYWTQKLGILKIYFLGFSTVDFTIFFFFSWENILHILNHY